MAVCGSGGMKRRVQLELNAPRVNWPILQSQPLECVLSDGTDPLSLSFPPSQYRTLSLSLSLPPSLSVLLHLFIHSLMHSHLTHTHTLPHSVCLTKSRLDFLVFYSFIHPLIHSFIQSLYHLTLQHATVTDSPALSPFPLFSSIAPHSFPSRTSLSSASFTLCFLPSLPHLLPLSHFSPSLSLSFSLIPVE